MSENIRRAIPEDVADITDMIHALAEFEHAADQCTITETQISTALFGNSPPVYGHVAEVDGEIAAMARSTTGSAGNLSASGPPIGCPAPGWPSWQDHPDRRRRPSARPRD